MWQVAPGSKLPPDSIADKERANDFPKQLIATHPGFDYLWLTAPVSRDGR
jgi:hypothetical protein